MKQEDSEIAEEGLQAYPTAEWIATSAPEYICYERSSLFILEDGVKCNIWDVVSIV